MANRKHAAAKTATARKRAAAPRVRPPSPYELPARGPLRDWLEQDLAAGVPPKAFARSTAALLRDLAEMLQRPEQDLAEFIREGTPVTARHFELLRLYQQELDAAGVDALVTGTSACVVGADAREAMARVVDARNRLARRAAASGLSLDSLDIRGITHRPGSLHGRCQLVIRTTRVQLRRFDNPAHARELLDELSAAADDLGALVREQLGNHLTRRDTGQRRRLLLASLYPFMRWLSRWGRVVFAGDADGLRRWRLGHTYRRRARPAPPVAPAPA